MEVLALYFEKCINMFWQNVEFFSVQAGGHIVTTKCQGVLLLIRLRYLDCRTFSQGLHVSINKNI